MKSIITGFILFFVLSLLAGCTGKSSRSGQGNDVKQSPLKTTFSQTPGKVVFFIENSESMFGYVSSISEYVEVLSELVEKPEFVKDKINREFLFINGLTPVVTPVGNDPVLLKNKLNQAGFRCGDITRSNLNAMFQSALDSAAHGNISILISDGIYDIGGQGVNSLVMSGRETRSRFIERLQSGDIQTILVKLHSQFNGKYFFASKKGSVVINSTRPYYLWILGESRLLNRYFPDHYLTQKLAGFDELARFMKPGKAVVPYEATSENFTGTFRFDPNIKNKITEAKSDRHGQGFRFSIAVDYSGLPYPESYLVSASNYMLNNNYTLVSVTRPAKRIYSLSFTPTHLITVHTMKNPVGKLEMGLLNNTPGWIAASSTGTEENMESDTAFTYGFDYLTGGIIQAYESVSEEKYIASFKIDIQ